MKHRSMDPLLLIGTVLVLAAILTSKSILFLIGGASYPMYEDLALIPVLCALMQPLRLNAPEISAC
jgi:hypothetical protein